MQNTHRADLSTFRTQDATSCALPTLHFLESIRMGPSPPRIAGNGLLSEKCTDSNVHLAES